MPHYFIASYDVADEKAYEAYVPAVVPLLQKHNAKIIVAAYERAAHEGEPANVNVVLEFESEEAALAWYNDPEYAPVKQIRLDSTKNGTAFTAAGFVMPTG
jgi:uncharacterized protein (DUF1330 family)